jgi:hypothetical protein
MCYFIIGPPLDVRFERDLEDDSAVWCSDIDPVMLENSLNDFEGRSW